MIYGAPPGKVRAGGQSGKAAEGSEGLRVWKPAQRWPESGAGEINPRAHGIESPGPIHLPIFSDSSAAPCALWCNHARQVALSPATESRASSLLCAFGVVTLEAQNAFSSSPTELLQPWLKCPRLCAHFPGAKSLLQKMSHRIYVLVRVLMGFCGYRQDLTQTLAPMQVFSMNE